MIIRGTENALTTRLTEAEKNLGIDLKLTQSGDLEINNLGDLNLVTGGRNAGQAAFLKLFIEEGGLLHHPEVGTNLQIGAKTVDAFVLRNQIIRSVSRDERFSSVDVRLDVQGNTIFVNLLVTLALTGIEVPLQFVAT